MEWHFDFSHRHENSRYSPMTSILKMLLITKTKSLKRSSSDSVFCKVRCRKITDNDKSKYTEKSRGGGCIIPRPPSEQRSVPAYGLWPAECSPTSRWRSEVMQKFQLPHINMEKAFRRWHIIPGGRRSQLQEGSTLLNDIFMY